MDSASYHYERISPDPYREPQIPFKSHVYIAHSFANSSPVFKCVQLLCDKLSGQFGIKCCHRYMPGDAGIKMRIDNSIRESEKCLLLMTKYDGVSDEDEFRNYELQMVHNKAKRFSNDSIIVLWCNVSRREEFNIYRNLDEQVDLEGYCADVDKFEILANHILAEPKAALSCLQKENSGYYSAMVYFYGFLHLILPDFATRCKKAISKYTWATPQMMERTICKLFIILPRSCFAPSTLADENKRIEVPKSLFVTLWGNRGGHVSKDYKSSMYKLTDQTTKECYYFAGEFAGSLVTLYDIYNESHLGWTIDELYQERDVFCNTLLQLLRLPANKACVEQYRLILWEDGRNSDGKYQLELYDLLLPIVKEELQKAGNMVENLETRSSTVACSVVSENLAASAEKRTFVYKGENYSSPTAFYESEEFDSYAISNGTRGQALVINNINFSLQEHSKRNGAEVDEETMKKLFETLGFETSVHRDVTREELELILMKYNSMNHSSHDAFICCIMTHGFLGHIYTADSKPYRILDVVDVFTAAKCPSLRGKPKIFFIQSCQSYVESTANSSDASKDIEVNESPNPEGIKSAYVPSEPDILISYSSLPESVSYRYPVTGSPYINALGKYLVKSLELSKALTLVTQGVKDQLSVKSVPNQMNADSGQFPFHVNAGMCKLIFLSPVQLDG